jgi:uncharacterized membrane protein YhiD involved in acid resistance
MNLEEKIKQLNGQFDFEEPNIGHFNRFESRLKQQSNNPKRKSIKNFALIASVVVLFISIGVISIKNNSNNIVNPEFQQTEIYFSQVIKEELKKIDTQKNPENKKIINDAFLQIKKLENDYKTLQKDLINTQNKKPIIYAMLENYQQRINILQNLINTLEQFNQVKKSDYEIQNI